MLRSMFAIVIVAAVLGGCKETSKTIDDGGLLDTVIDLSDLTRDNYPRVDGSTSTHPLQVIIACHLLNTNYFWEEIYDGTTRAIPTSADPDKQPDVSFISSDITHNGTHGSYVNLIEDNADLILVAREPSEDELTMASDLGVTLDVFAVALDAFVFIENVENPVETLTEAEVQGIYTGAITNWNEVGGDDAEIHAYQRDANSGSQQLMLSLVMTGLDMIDAPDMILLGMMGPINRISMDELGLGYTVYFFKQFMAPSERLKMIGIDGVQPDTQSIGTRSYRYTTEVFVVTREGLDEQGAAYRLRQWLRTLKGQDVIGESGYVPGLVVAE